MLLRTTEVTLGEWRAFLFAADLPGLDPDLLGVPLEDVSAPGMRRSAACGFTRDEAREFLAWLDAELVRARAPVEASLPRLDEFHRAVRGELPWRFPWGREFDESFCHCSAAGGVPWTKTAFAADESPFGILALAGSMSEFLGQAFPLPDRRGAYAMVAGGDWTGSASNITAQVTGFYVVRPSTRNGWTGFRYVLNPRAAPLPPPRSDAARARALQEAAWEARGRQDLAGAQRLLTEALDADPLDSVLWNLRGVVRLDRDDTWGAWWDFTRAIDLAPDSAPLWVNRAEAHARELAYADALADLDRALEFEQGVPYIWGERARWRWAHGDFEGATSDLKEALRREPEGTSNAREWARALAEMRDELAKQRR